MFEFPFHTTGMRRVAAAIRRTGVIPDGALNPEALPGFWAVPPLTDYISRKAAMGPQAFRSLSPDPSFLRVLRTAAEVVTGPTPLATMLNVIETYAEHQPNWLVFRMWLTPKLGTDAEDVSPAMLTALGMAVGMSHVFPDQALTLASEDGFAVSAKVEAPTVGVVCNKVWGLAGEPVESLPRLLNEPRAIAPHTVWPALRVIRELVRATNGVPVDTKLELDSIIAVTGMMYRRRLGCAEDYLSPEEVAYNDGILSRFLALALEPLKTGTVNPEKLLKELELQIAAVNEALAVVADSGTVMPEKHLLASLLEIVSPKPLSRSELYVGVYGEIKQLANLGLVPASSETLANIQLVLSNALTKVRGKIEDLQGEFNVDR